VILLFLFWVPRAVEEGRWQESWALLVVRGGNYYVRASDTFERFARSTFSHVFKKMADIPIWQCPPDLGYPLPRYP
jgi:hypothetical protein